MLSVIHNYFSQNVITVPFNIPLSMAMGYYIDGKTGMMAATTLSIADLVLKYNDFDSYYLTFLSMGSLTGQKVAVNLINHYKCYTKSVKDNLSQDKIDILEHLLPVSMSAMGLVAAYAMNKIEHTIVDYMNDNNEETALVAKDDVAEILEVG